MKTQKTILAALTRQIQFVVQKAKFPIVVSVIRPKQEVSFNGFRDIQQCLSSVAAVNLNPHPINLNVKLKNNVQIEHIDFGVVFDNQSKFFRDIIEEKKEEIRELLNNQWEIKNSFNH